MPRTERSRHLLLLAGVFALLATACSGGADDASPTDPAPADGGSTEDADATVDDVPVESAITFTGSRHDLVPADAGAVFDVDLAALVGDDAAWASTSDDRIAPFLDDVFDEIARLTAFDDRPADLGRVSLVLPGDPGHGLVLLAEVETSFEADATHAGSGVPLAAVGDQQVALVPGGAVIVGHPDAVASTLDALAAPEPAGPSAVRLADLDDEATMSFVLALPAASGEVAADRSLRGATALTGGLDVVGGALSGEIVFDSVGAETFVESFNALNRHALGAPGSTEVPLVADGDQVVVTLPTMPFDPTAAEATAAQSFFKKLFVGMEAHDYAEDVVDGGAQWFDLLVTSPDEGGAPGTAASSWYRFRFKDEAAIAEFEENELPEGYRLAPTRFYESDPSEGEYFVAINIYNSGGGSIVSGARAEWDFFVYGPEGGPDPNPNERPRFFVADALAETVSFDPVQLVTPAEPVRHRIEDGAVVSDIARFDGEGPEAVWFSTFPLPSAETNELARFTREMAIGNDYIYWGGGAADRGLWNGTTYNHEAFIIDPADITWVDNSRYAQYLEPELLDVVYYENALDYIVSPLANLDSEQLRVTDEWREELIGFKTNGHQEGLMRKAVELLFRGSADAMVGYTVGNQVPSTFHHFAITDVAGFEAAINLPEGHSLMPVAILDGAEPGYYVSLSVVEADDAPEGVRATWVTYTDPGTGRAKQVALEVMTEHVGLEPVSVLSLPTGIAHAVDGDTVTTSLSSPSIAFESVVELGAAEAVSTDWVESGDQICHLNGTCDAFYYDAETLDVPPAVASTVEITAMSTPWDAFIDPEPVLVFARRNLQEYATKRWFDVDVPVDELPFTGLEGATHEITGTGTLVGRVNDVVDSQYTYSGDALIDGDELVFSLNQEIVNTLGTGNIFTRGRFDLDTGTGTQTVVDCLGPALLCADVAAGETSIYTVSEWEVQLSDPPIVTWRVDLAIVLGGAFGTADSASVITATPLG